MTKSQQIVLNGKHCYEVAIGNGKTEEEALAFAHSILSRMQRLRPGFVDVGSVQGRDNV